MKKSAVCGLCQAPLNSQKRKLYRPLQLEKRVGARPSVALPPPQIIRTGSFKFARQEKNVKKEALLPKPELHMAVTRGKRCNSEQRAPADFISFEQLEKVLLLTHIEAREAASL